MNFHYVIMREKTSYVVLARYSKKAGAKEQVERAKSNEIYLEIKTVRYGGNKYCDLQNRYVSYLNRNIVK